MTYVVRLLTFQLKLALDLSAPSLNIFLDVELIVVGFEGYFGEGPEVVPNIVLVLADYHDTQLPGDLHITHIDYFSEEIQQGLPIASVAFIEPINYDESLGCIEKKRVQQFFAQVFGRQDKLATGQELFVTPRQQVILPPQELA